MGEYARDGTAGSDITVLRQTFLAVVHDLRSPLTTTIGLAQVLERRLKRNDRPPDLAAIADGLHQIIVAAISMEQRLAGAVALAWIGDGQPVHVVSPSTDLVELAGEIVEQFRTAQSGRPIILQASQSALTGGWDRGLLRGVLDNLLSNACKYSPADRPVTVTVDRVASDTREQTWAVLLVRDEGIGIPPADLPYIFDWRFRGAAAEKLAPGQGIGLASVRSAVEHHGGRVTVATEAGRGTAVTVHLPCDLAGADMRPEN
jgi:signal transduction histidine kinase